MIQNSNTQVTCPACGWGVNYGGLGGHFAMNHLSIARQLSDGTGHRVGVECGNLLRQWFRDGVLESNLKPYIALAAIRDLG